jgi:pyruvate-ferredoxin/flavodoxin oxidoreductase
MLQHLAPGGTFLLNSPYGAGEIWDHLPHSVQAQLIDKRAQFYVIDAYRVARDSGMNQRINTVMQVCFFAIAGVLPQP